MSNDVVIRDVTSEYKRAKLTHGEGLVIPSNYKGRMPIKQNPEGGTKRSAKGSSVRMEIQWLVSTGLLDGDAYFITDRCCLEGGW